ncbi:uncharacterized protein PHACADRAFT_261044 [Phanerochaete carnosa HHB-10118-sp]|uniref:Ricin B lectin domain-containing protein n=1 Tax=Phanerochaete carnosa (strain HHB-10118-sp) TaxID=650164 RepID=K5WQC3_PHACS|nr:uncharacterized protein PHACADRAFT_261044 [Phanerochaete carnosa HHB-10118-sp]EKM52547.1 hypothetical protein PHACADRAFT_261044 [Phanerochaete carnosa HHB-10118-sp]
MLSFTAEIAARPGYKRFLYKGEDAGAIKALDSQLTHAFQVFVVQSSISLRVSQQQMTQKLEGTVAAAPSHLVTNVPLRVPEGIYIVRSAADGRVLEIEHARARSWQVSVHVYVAPFHENVSPYQLWTVFKNGGKSPGYTVRSFAVGAALDVCRGEATPGTQVIGHPWHTSTNQLWAFYATRSATGYDYCTIRSYGPPTVMDAKCPSGSECDLLHMSHLQEDGPYASQEWSLMRLPTAPSIPRPPLTPTAALATPENITRRKFWLQNVASGGYAKATGLDSKTTNANVLLESSGERAGLWHFVLIAEEPRSEHFAIVTGVAPRLATLDHYGQRCVLASAERFWPSDSHHVWTAILRDGAFAFRNRASGRLLYQGRTAGIVDTAPSTECDNPACLWRLIDPHTSEPCRVLYDATVNVALPEIAGLEEGAQAVAPRMFLRTQDAPADVSQRFTESLEVEHELVRAMLNNGHTTVVLGPQCVMGWKGRILKTYLDEEDSVLGKPKFKGKGDYDPCPS